MTRASIVPVFVVVATGTSAIMSVVVSSFVPLSQSRCCCRRSNDNSLSVGVKSDRHKSLSPLAQSRNNAGSHELRRFIRILPRTSRTNRQSFGVQTAVTTFERVGKESQRQTVDLHAQIHFGRQDYFDFYNSKDFRNRYDRVHYELLIDENLMEVRNGLRYLPPGRSSRGGIMSSPSDAKIASQYGLACQVDVMDFTDKGWVHADLTRQELLRLTHNKNNPHINTDTQPLWALASTAANWPASEAITALFRPSTPSTSLSSPVARRLFSNLFLSGNSLTALLRGLFWVAVPSPELSVMLLDWSSILPRPTGGISQVAMPVLESLLAGNIQEARQLVFGQMLVGAQQASSDEHLLVKKRNEHAVEVLRISLERDHLHKTALLYGAMHCHDLQQRLLAMGFTATKSHWKTAWSVSLPSFGTGSSKGDRLESFAASSSPAALAVGLVILPLYLLIGGLDWIGTLNDLASSVNSGGGLDALLIAAFYLLRHVMLYLGLAKFVVDWDGGIGLFGVQRQS